MRSLFHMSPGLKLQLNIGYVGQTLMRECNGLMTAIQGGVLCHPPRRLTL